MSRSDATSLLHPAYRHLDRTVRLAGLSLAQWTQLVAAGVVAWALARVLPFGATYDLSIAVTVAGVPVAAAFAAGSGQTSPLATVAAALRWRRRAAVYAPGIADPAITGYALTGPARGPGEGDG